MHKHFLSWSHAARSEESSPLSLTLFPSEEIGHGHPRFSYGEPSSTLRDCVVACVSLFRYLAVQDGLLSILMLLFHLLVVYVVTFGVWCKFPSRTDCLEPFSMM